MLRSNAPKNSQGFTLIEILTVLLIIGILSAIAVPSFLGLLNRGKVNNALAQVRGALQEAQRESIRKSKTCTVVVPAGNNVTLTSPTNCLVTGDRKLEGIAIRRSNSPLTFNFRGGIGIGSGTTIVLTSTDGSLTKQKCLVMASGIGIMRTGDYDNNDTTGTDSDKCSTSQ